MAEQGWFGCVSLGVYVAQVEALFRVEGVSYRLLMVCRYAISWSVSRSMNLCCIR